MIGSFAILAASSAASGFSLMSAGGGTTMVLRTFR